MKLKKITTSLLILFFPIFINNFAHADRPSEGNSSVMFHLTDFRPSYLLAANSTGYTSTGQILWSPCIAFEGSSVGTRFLIGTTLLKDGAGTLFMAPEFQLLGNYSISPQFVLELGGGIQYWSKGSSVNGLITLQGVYYLNESPSTWIRGLLAGLSVSPNTPTNYQFRLGIEITL